MSIATVQPVSFIDCEDKVSAVLFFSGCNFRCPSCHAKKVVFNDSEVGFDSVLSFLNDRSDWIESVVLCGGEPTIDKDIVKVAAKLKSMGFYIKLDTNGTRPDVLSELLNRKLVDYVAMDVKGPACIYDRLAGVDVDMSEISKSIKLITKFPKYEFRTTVVPVIEDSAIFRAEFLSEEQLKDTAVWVCELTGSVDHKYYIQKFVPRENGLLDRRLESFDETSEDYMNRLVKSLKCLIPNISIRNQ